MTKVCVLGNYGRCKELQKAMIFFKEKGIDATCAVGSYYEKALDQASRGQINDPTSTEAWNGVSKIHALYVMDRSNGQDGGIRAAIEHQRSLGRGVYADSQRTKKHYGDLVIDVLSPRQLAARLNGCQI